jgi:hypothetical protein
VYTLPSMLNALRLKPAPVLQLIYELQIELPQTGAAVGSGIDYLAGAHHLLRYVPDVAPLCRGKHRHPESWLATLRQTYGQPSISARS